MIKRFDLTGIVFRGEEIPCTGRVLRVGLQPGTKQLSVWIDDQGFEETIPQITIRLVATCQEAPGYPWRHVGTFDFAQSNEVWHAYEKGGQR